MNNEPINSPSKNKKEMVDQALQALQGKFILVGKHRVRAWHIWLVVGILIGAMVGILWVANRTNEFTQSKAATGLVIYQASSDFSSTQGSKQWYYLDGQGTQLTWIPSNPDCGGYGCWKGSEQYLLIGGNWVHPGSNSDVVLRWAAPQAGTIHITTNIGNNIRDLNGSCGDGVTVYIRKGTTELWR